jgi:hypothetical protein
VLAAVFDPGIVDPDFDFDGDVDMADFGHLQRCLAGFTPAIGDCMPADLDGDTYVDQRDYTIFAGCLSGAGIAPNPSCDN